MKNKVSNIFKNIKSIYQKCSYIINQKDKYEIFPVIFSSIIIVLLLEMLSRHSILGSFAFIFKNPLMFLMNIAIVMSTLSLSLFFKKRRFFLLLISAIWLILGITDFVILFFRSTPFTAMDLYLLDNVFKIIPLYFNIFEILVVVLMIPILIVGLVILWRKTDKKKPRYKTGIIMVVISAVLMLLLYGSAMKLKKLSASFGNLPDAYSNYGFAYCFSNSIFDRGIKEPDNYSEGQINQVIEKLEDEQKPEENKEDVVAPNGEGDEATPEETKGFKIGPKLKQNPNIIIVQLESFFDVNYLLDYEFSENPVANFTKLKSNHSSGFLTVPSIGAGTANTEFEVLSGMNIEYFGAGEYPYKTILQTTTTESIGYDLAMLGYNSHAIHNNTGTFYDRKDVYQKLGFDSFSSIEYMNNIELNPIGWAKDAVLKDEILKALEASDEKDFIYTVTVQAHGKYPHKVVDENQTITVNVAPQKREALEKGIAPNTMDYLLEYDMDEVGDVEQTPGFKNDKTDDPVTDDSTLDENNPDENNPNEVNASSSEEETTTQIDLVESYKNQLEYYVNQLAGTDRFIGDLITSLETYKEPTVVVFFGDHLPSLSFTEDDLYNHNMYQTEYVIWSNFEMENVRKDLHAYQLGAYVQARVGFESGYLTRYHQRCIEEPDYQEKLKMLQYDMLYGNRNIFDGANPFVEKELKMGVHEIEITDVSLQGEAYVVTGTNFTPYSEVYIGDEAKETIFISDTTLIVPYEDLSGLTIHVAQVTEGKTILSKSAEWTVE